MSYFSLPGFPLAKSNEKGIYNKRSTINTILTAGSGYYRVGINPDGNLAFYYKNQNQNPDKDNNESTPHMILPKEEINQIVFGLIEQARNGLGRTSFSQLEKMLKLINTDRYREEYEKNKQEYEKLTKS